MRMRCVQPWMAVRKRRPTSNQSMERRESDWRREEERRGVLKEDGCGRRERVEAEAEVAT